MFKNDTNYLDQHFLIDNKVINDFVKEVDPKIDDIIVEIGPGKGVITKQIIPYVNNYTVIEKDNNDEENSHDCPGADASHVDGSGQDRCSELPGVV